MPLRQTISTTAASLASSGASRLAVVRHDGRYRALAARAFAAGEEILRLEGEIGRTADRFSLQIGADEHLVLPAGCDLERAIDAYPWRFLDHACAPNATIRGRSLVALHDVACFEGVTFDYDTTEWELAAPFPCACGAVSCRQEIRGFRHLPSSERERLVAEGLVASHLSHRSDHAEG